jgi:hypothetical protein
VRQPAKHRTRHRTSLPRGFLARIADTASPNECKQAQPNGQAHRDASDAYALGKQDANALNRSLARGWADQWLAGLRNPSENTKRSYVATLEYAKRAFGNTQVRNLTRIAMERGAELKWLQGQMGHATLSRTADRYGHFGEAARKREASKLDGAVNL